MTTPAPAFLLPTDLWEAITDHLDATGCPWPPAACTADVLAHDAQVAAGALARKPGSPYYAARWRVTDFEARKRMLQARAVEAPAITEPPSAAARAAVDSSRPPDQQLPAGPVDPAIGRQRRDAPAAGLLFPNSSSTRGGAPAPIDSQDLTQEITTDQEIRSGGAGGYPQAAVDAAAADPVRNEGSLGDEARAFLAVWRTWGPNGTRRQGLRADHPARQWTGNATDALAWFLGDIVGSPDYRGLDVRQGLVEWGDYLDDKADKWGKPDTANRGRFPSRWKQALRRWFDNRKAWARDNSSRPGYNVSAPRAAAPARGTWAGTRQPAAAAPRPPSDDDFDTFTSRA